MSEATQYIHCVPKNMWLHFIQ